MSTNMEFSVGGTAWPDRDLKLLAGENLHSGLDDPDRSAAPIAVANWQQTHQALEIAKRVSA